ncbi:hypothetical protein BDV38DRAFT_179363 [Aspergillus pseudotamarii]|uniref:BZIP domain-containing protein n=1 Tax=Aspergillus pseudotamarii TaxID=132259 RepID=A0A5N6SGT3_ASPPS|nr:uncharacterized protein BDV38DRAFT_179363 [Aspergillus pseudotamarii]KAE8133928.1 hypothetical protein BDV38DRAFT_179363 [Aspergillus pseudotamarii]
MSPISPVTGPSSEDALRTEKHSALEKKRPFVDEDSSWNGREPGRPRPVSWHPSTPVEPPLSSTQLRPIGVDSILNPPARAPSVSASTAETGREGLGDQFSTSPSHQHLPPATVHLPSPSTHAKRLSASPGVRSRQIISPVSPSARFVSSGVGYPRKASASQSPLVQETRPGAYTVTPGSPLPVDSVAGQPMSVSGYQQPVPVSVHSTPTFHSRRTSANPTPNPSPQETSPTTPISTFSQFGRSSPAATTASGPQPAPSYLHSTPHTTMEPVSRLPSVVAGHKHVSEEPVVLPSSQAENPPYPGMIPCILDLKSGSSSQAEKRKANSDASRRFRNRKRNELQMEQKITAQQDEIRKQTEVLQRQAQEIRALMQERDFYRSERDFYREHVSRLGPSGQIPARPVSPRSFQSSDRDPQVWPSTDTTQRTVDTSGVPPPASATRAAGSWPSRGTLADEQQARSLPQFPGPWTRA